jgi:hypothetical protein
MENQFFMNNYLHTIINRKHTTQKPPVRKSTLIQFLNENGYKPLAATLPNLFLNSSGHIFNLSTYKRMSGKESRKILENLKKTKPSRRLQLAIMKRDLAMLLYDEYRHIPEMGSLFINRSGKVINFSTGNEIKPTKRNHILWNGRYLSIAKLLLLTFYDEPYRQTARIKHRDGDRGNFSAYNLAYTTKYPTPNKVDYEKLKTAIRCYFEVEKRYTAKNYFNTRLYLKVIIKTRRFFLKYSQDPNVGIFKSYMSKVTNSRARVAKMYRITVRDCNHIINDFINLLVNDILTDLQNGKLAVMKYRVAKTKTQQIREN